MAATHLRLKVEVQYLLTENPDVKDGRRSAGLFSRDEKDIMSLLIDHAPEE